MSIFDRVVVPVAGEEDARATARALDPHLEDGSRIVVVHVVRDVPGAPDPAPTVDLLDDAEDLFRVFEEGLEGSGAEVRREARHAADVADAVIDVADEAGASAIVFTPRGGSRWVKLLAGDVTTPLIEGSSVPLVVLPDVE